MFRGRSSLARLLKYTHSSLHNVKLSLRLPSITCFSRPGTYISQVSGAAAFTFCVLNYGSVCSGVIFYYSDYFFFYFGFVLSYFMGFLCLGIILFFFLSFFITMECFLVCFLSFELHFFFFFAIFILCIFTNSLPVVVTPKFRMTFFFPFFIAFRVEFYFIIIFCFVFPLLFHYQFNILLTFYNSGIRSRSFLSSLFIWILAFYVFI